MNRHSFTYESHNSGFVAWAIKVYFFTRFLKTMVAFFGPIVLVTLFIFAPNALVAGLEVTTDLMISFAGVLFESAKTIIINWR